ncbi:MAG: tyrosine-type recombinase/integrase [Lachnospiraceae bacterium]|nr:tyrosine-type recombinase/integrase [Lachnospiraceae bacterium]
MDARTAYHTQVDKENTLKLRELLKELPPFARDYFRAIGTTASSRTRLSYAYDLKVFFQYLLMENPLFQNYAMEDFRVDVLDALQAVDIEEYQEYLRVYQSKDTGLENTNGERGIKRKMSSLRSFYAYYYKREMIHTNPTLLVDMPKLHDKSIVKLDPDEVATLLDYIEHAGDTLTGQKKTYYEKTKERDLAIFTLLLGTGIRVSECVGLDVEDIDFQNNGIKVHRKGGNEMIVYFGEEVAQALLDYLEVREGITPLAGHEHALFYSTQRRRIGVKAVENLVKKYSQAVTTTKKITPHKLRSTYGTALYEETGDIYLVADVLGHKDVNTTRKHYADLGDARRRKAATAVRLREK